MHGVPEILNENIYESVLKVCNIGLKLNVQKNDIKKCFRVKSKQHNSNPNDTKRNKSKVVVIFDRKSNKDLILKNWRESKNLLAKNCGFDESNKVYIQETLSMYKKTLLFKTKELKNNGSVKYVWVRDGSIMVRKEEGGVIVHINTIFDLDKIKNNTST